MSDQTDEHAPPQADVPAEGVHEWVKNDPRWPSTRGIQLCAVCGMGWRADGKNKPCAGRAPGVELRALPQASSDQTPDVRAGTRRGLNVDVLDADRLDAWAVNIERYGKDITNWTTCAWLAGELRRLSTAVEAEVRDVGQLRAALDHAEAREREQRAEIAELRQELIDSEGYRQQCSEVAAEVARLTRELAEARKHVIDYQAGVDLLRNELAEARARLDVAAPYACPTCGPNIKVDEDLCCAACGADSVLIASKEPR